MMLVAPEALRQVVEAAEAAYPNECCGLLVGHARPNGTVEVSRAHASANLGKQPTRFEIDPRLWVDLARALGKGPNRVVGLYHSHPDGPAQPSAVDLGAAWGEELIWLIVSVSKGEAIQVTAHILDHDGKQFRELPLRTTDWAPYPVRLDPDKPPEESP
jgi:proteasome lid subunit RPN8/RPN11